MPRGRAPHAQRRQCGGDDLLRGGEGASELQRHGRGEGGPGSELPLPGPRPRAAGHPGERASARGPSARCPPARLPACGRMLKANADTAPLRRNTTQEDVAKSTVYLLSDLSAGVTGETHHVDCGYNIMGLTMLEDEAK